MFVNVCHTYIEYVKHDKFLALNRLDSEAQNVYPLRPFLVLNRLDSWTYRDEDFGGTVAKYSKRRGGKNTPLSTGRNVLMNFYAKHRVPAA